MPPDTDTPKVLEFSAGEIAIHGWLNLLVVSWIGPAHRDSVARLKEARTRFMAQHPEGFSIVHILMQPSKAPDNDTRASLVDMMRRYSENIAGIAVVTPGGGFYASATRSRVTNMRIEAPGDFKLRFHSSVAEVNTWLPDEHERRTGVRLDPVRLLRCLQELSSEDGLPAPSAR